MLDVEAALNDMWKTLPTGRSQLATQAFDPFTDTAGRSVNISQPLSDLDIAGDRNLTNSSAADPSLSSLSADMKLVIRDFSEIKALLQQLVNIDQLEPRRLELTTPNSAVESQSFSLQTLERSLAAANHQIVAVEQELFTAQAKAVDAEAKALESETRVQQVEEKLTSLQSRYDQLKGMLSAALQAE